MNNMHSQTSKNQADCIDDKGRNVLVVADRHVKKEAWEEERKGALGV